MEATSPWIYSMVAVATTRSRIALLRSRTITPTHRLPRLAARAASNACGWSRSRAHEGRSSCGRRIPLARDRATIERVAGQLRLDHGWPSLAMLGLRRALRASAIELACAGLAAASPSARQHDPQA